jgi:hypothetical protein
MGSELRAPRRRAPRETVVERFISNPRDEDFKASQGDLTVRLHWEAKKVGAIACMKGHRN